MPVRVAQTLVGLLGLALACQRDGVPRESGSHEIATHERDDATSKSEADWELPIGLVGCDALFDGATCMRASALPLVLWLPGRWEARDFDLRLDGRPLDGARVEWQSGERGLLIRLREQPRECTLTLVHHGGRAARVRLESTPIEYTRVLELATRDRDAARAWLGDEGHEAGGRVSLLFDMLYMRLTLGEQSPAAGAALSRIVGRAQMLGERRAVAQLHLHMAHVYMSQSQYNSAADAVTAARRSSERAPDVAVSADQLDGTLAQRIGQIEVSLELLDRATVQARDIRLGDDPRFWEMPATLAVARALALADIGRHDEADQLGDLALAELRGRWDTSAKIIRNNVAWLRVLRREVDPLAADPVPEMRVVVERDPRNSTWLNLAIASSQVGLFDEAAGALGQIDVDRLGDRNVVWYELAASRVARGRGRDGWQHLERALMVAERGREPEALLQIRLERARYRFEAGDRIEARHEFELADRIADRIALSIDGTSGRSLFSSSRSRSRGLHVELLLDLGENSAALCTVLGSRARHLRALAAGSGSLADLDSPTRRLHREKLGEYHVRKAALLERERATWKLSAADSERELRQLELEFAALDGLLGEIRRVLEQDPPEWRCDSVRPRSDDRGLLTMISDADGAGWYFFFDRGDEPEVSHLSRAEGESAAELAARGLAEFAEPLAGVTELTVVATGEFAGLDFQALAPGTSRVVHGLGLGESPTTAWRGRASVYTGDGGLIYAAREASQVSEALADAGWQLVEWAPGDDDQPDLLHFSGHGLRAGTTGWRSELQLADGDWLSSGELITSRRSARVVVLGACTAGMTSPEAIDGGMNMAVAFLLAGADMVIAPNDDIDDEVAAELAGMLYDEMLPASHRELRDHLLDRLAAAKDDDPRFRGWRVWVR